jgi:hypothetical protein
MTGNLKIGARLPSNRGPTRVMLVALKPTNGLVRKEPNDETDGYFCGSFWATSHGMNSDSE